MKILHSLVAALAIGVASITSAQAHDSFSFGLNIRQLWLCAACHLLCTASRLL